MINSAIRTLVIIGVMPFASCDSEEAKKSYPLEFLVLDATTGLAIINAEIQVLEDGPTVKTNIEGVAGFNEVDLTEGLVESITDSVAYGFSIRHTGYRPKELNASPGRTIIKLIPVSADTYTYQKPIQLDDDLAVATLADVGFDVATMQQLMDKIAKPGYSDLHSILIYKDGALVLEEYYYGNNDTINFEGGVIRDRSPKPIWWTRNEKHYVASVNKALTSTLTGIALGSKGLTTDVKLKDYLPEYASYFENDTKKSEVTFKHALNMNLGFQWDEWGSTDLVKLWKSDDFAEFLLSRTNAGAGSAWYYNSASPNVLLKCIETMVGEPIRTWAHTHFYARLGITDYKWQYQPDGYPEGAARMYLRPRDMLKIGVTYLNRGKWKGKQVIPESWVDQCLQVQEHPSAGDYSHFFWIRSLKGITFLSADGDGGNYINIFPEQNMVIVLTQGNYLQWPLYVNQANDIMGSYILPALD